ncbi:MAG: hypothetical protein AAFQ41_13460 [Cyanobacteria bacterium J06623_7]
MNIQTLRQNVVRHSNTLLGKIKNTKQNLNYLRDLESWGTAEIINFNETHIEYRLI